MIYFIPTEAVIKLRLRTRNIYIRMMFTAITRDVRKYHYPTVNSSLALL